MRLLCLQICHFLFFGNALLCDTPIADADIVEQTCIAHLSCKFPGH